MTNENWKEIVITFSWKNESSHSSNTQQQEKVWADIHDAMLVSHSQIQNAHQG
jgi:hypothetical protein